ncbi:MAG: hypothetical protein LBV76_04710 [Deltaproteobacteria bacterium]|jgi:hypothetical protein|nr:hypothetical protein [Deltaproteobacteria bacterium]
MEITTPSSAEASVAAATASRAIKDTLGADLISKTLDTLNASSKLSGAQEDQSYQFQKEVLSAAGIGRGLDIEV